ncbi:MAG: acetylxylan esterase [Planctomycetes bacterium]|nr:acetylxylan esterase [Planctomycetota bacterium]
MYNHRRIIIAIVFAFLSNSVLLAAPKQDQAISQQRSMKYTSRPKEDARTWQEEVRAKLFLLLKMDNSLQGRNSIPFSAKELSRADRGTYLIIEVEINSTSSRRIRVVVTIPNSKDKPVPAVVCIGGHGSDLYSPYDPKTIVGQGPRKKTGSIYKEFGTVLTETGYVTISTTVSQHEVYEKDRLLMAERLWDLIRCVDYLQSIAEVDNSRIGCAGLSLGGEMAMWLGAMDKRIAATVSAGFLTTMDHMEQNHCMCWKFEGLREQVDFADVYSLIAPRPLQCQNGMLEPASQFYVPLARRAMEEIRTIYKDLERPENVILDVHGEGHVIDLPGLIYFFEKHLYENRWKQKIYDMRSKR